MDYDETKVAATADGRGGAIIVWTDYRPAPDIFAQRVDSMGIAQWTMNGVPVCGDSDHVQLEPVAASDGAGGALIAWLDTRIFQWHVFAQRIDSSGQAMWIPNGQVVDGTSGVKLGHAIASDGSGGAFVSWNSYSSGAWRRFVQRIVAEGATLWNPGGLLLSGSETAGDYLNGMVSDDRGGAICTWRQGDAPSCSLFAQRIDANGNQLWDLGDTRVASGPFSNVSIPTVSDGAGRLITVWGQSGAGDLDLFAQRVGTADQPVSSRPAPSGLTISAAPNPSRGGVVLFAANARPTGVRAMILDLHGRVVRDLGSVTVGPFEQEIHWDGLDNGSRPVESGVYFARLANRQEGWTVRFAVIR
jgi:hypothetical protein